MKLDFLKTLPDYPRLFLEIAHSSSDVVIIADAARTIIYANPTTLQITGYRRQELVGKKIPILYRKENQSRYTSRIFNELHRKGRYTGEVEVRKKDGTTFWTATTILAYYDDHGKVAGTIGIGRDLSGERLLAQKLHQSEMARIADAMEDGLLVCDSKGKILLCNASYCRILGYRKDEIVGVSPPYSWLDQAYNLKFQQGLKLAMRQGTLKNYTLTLRGRTGSAIKLSMAFSLYKGSDHNHPDVVITARDVTDVQYVEDLHRSEEQIRRLVVEVKRKAERIETLQKINSLVLNGSSLATIFRSITAGVKKLVEHDLAGIYVFDEEEGAFLPHTLSKQTPFSRKLAKFPIPLGEGIIGAAATSGEMVWVNNAQFDPRARYPEGMRPSVEHFIAVPLKEHQSIFGVLVVARNRSPEFIEEEVLVVQSFADAVAVALENARLHQACSESNVKIPQPLGAPPRDRVSILRLKKVPTSSISKLRSHSPRNIG